MTSESAVPTPVRSFTDPVTGVNLHQLTDAPEGAAHLYFTRRSWTADGEWLVLVRKHRGGLNYLRARRGGELEPLSDYPPRSFDSPHTRHMHRWMPSWEVDRNMIRQPALHPREPVLVFALNDRIHRLEIPGGRDEVLHEFGPEDSEQGLTNLQTQFTADGRDLLIATTRRAAPGERIDPPERRWHTLLRDESSFVSRLWRLDPASGALRGPVFAANGEASHVLACPWDPDLVVWVSYLHKCLYLARRDGGELRSVLAGPRAFPGHYSWDAANRRLTLLVSDPCRNWRSAVASLDPESGRLRRFRAGRQWSQCHQNASPDGRWIVLDARRYRVGGENGLLMLDQERDRLYALCQLRCSWKPPRDAAGRAVKSEFLHPNPSFSPCGRWVAVSSDFGSGVPQVYLVDLATWKPRLRVREPVLSPSHLARWALARLPERLLPKHRPGRRPSGPSGPAEQGLE